MEPCCSGLRGISQPKTNDPHRPKNTDSDQAGRITAYETCRQYIDRSQPLLLPDTIRVRTCTHHTTGAQPPDCEKKLRLIDLITEFIFEKVEELAEERTGIPPSYVENGQWKITEIPCINELAGNDVCFLKPLEEQGGELIKELSARLERLIYSEPEPGVFRVSVYTELNTMVDKNWRKWADSLSGAPELLQEFFSNAIHYEALMNVCKSQCCVDGEVLDNLWRLLVDRSQQGRGRFVFENEPGYLVNAMMSLLYLFNSSSSDTRLTYQHLLKANRLAGGVHSGEGSGYPMGVSKYRGERIPNYHELKHFLENNFCILSKEQKEDILKVIPDLNLKLSSSQDPGWIKSDCYDYKLSFRTDKSDHQAAKIYLTYAGLQSKQEKVQALLDAYYDRVEGNSLALIELLTITVEVCRDVQRVHPFNDGNGRTCVFALLPALLLRKGYLLTNIPDAPWKIDLCSSHAYALELKPLCKETSALFSEPVDWCVGLSSIKGARLACQEDNIALVKQSVYNDFSPLKTVRPSACSLLNIAVLSESSTVLNYLIDKISQQDMSLAAGEVNLEAVFQKDSVEILELLHDRFKYTNAYLINVFNSSMLYENRRCLSYLKGQDVFKGMELDVQYTLGLMALNIYDLGFFKEVIGLLDSEMTLEKLATTKSLGRERLKVITERLNFVREQYSNDKVF